MIDKVYPRNEIAFFPSNQTLLKYLYNISYDTFITIIDTQPVQN